MGTCVFGQEILYFELLVPVTHTGQHQFPVTGTKQGVFGQGLGYFGDLVPVTHTGQHQTPVTGTRNKLSQSLIDLSLRHRLNSPSPFSSSIRKSRFISSLLNNREDPDFSTAQDQIHDTTAIFDLQFTHLLSPSPRLLLLRSPSPPIHLSSLLHSISAVNHEDHRDSPPSNLCNSIRKLSSRAVEALLCSVQSSPPSANPQEPPPFFNSFVTLHHATVFSVLHRLLLRLCVSAQKLQPPVLSSTHLLRPAQAAEALVQAVV